MEKERNKLTCQLMDHDYKMPRQAQNSRPFPDSRANVVLQQQGYNTIQSRKLKSCSVNTSHSKALAFQYTSNPLAIDTNKSSQDKAKS